MLIILGDGHQSLNIEINRDLYIHIYIYVYIYISNYIYIVSTYHFLPMAHVLCNVVRVFFKRILLQTRCR